MAPVRIAVIGAGLIGRTHIGVLRAGNPDYTLAAVADPSPAAAQEGKTLGYPVHAVDRRDARQREAGRRDRRGAEPVACEGRARLHCAQDSDHRREAGRGLGRRGARTDRGGRARGRADPHRASPPPQPDHAQGGRDHRERRHRARGRGERAVAQPQAEGLFQHHVAARGRRRADPDQRDPRHRLPAHAVRRRREP